MGAIIIHWRSHEEETSILFVCSTGAVAVRDGSVFSDATRSVFLSGPDCTGTESSLDQCPKHTTQNCIAQGGVAVICQGRYVCMYVCHTTQNRVVLCLG